MQICPIGQGIGGDFVINLGASGSFVFPQELQLELWALLARHRG